MGAKVFPLDEKPRPHCILYRAGGQGKQEETDLLYLPCSARNNGKRMGGADVALPGVGHWIFRSSEKPVGRGCQRVIERGG
jgi:hypothetical protein